MYNKKICVKYLDKFFGFLTNSKKETSKDFLVISNKHIRNIYETWLKKTYKN